MLMSIMRNPSTEIAVVDDDVAVLDSFRFMLELAGFTVATYPSALAFLADDKADPRCIILDHFMPSMTGLELTTRLRAHGVDVPVLLITSAPNPTIVAEAKRIGVRVLEKPPNESELIQFVTETT
jgi:FixJ family two-component response regulator